MKKTAKKKPGRKPKGGRVYSVKLTDEVAEQLRRLGNDNLTRGIETAAHMICLSVSDTETSARIKMP